MPVTKHVKEVCKIGQGEFCCRYLTMGVNGFECEKHSKAKEILDHKVNTAQMVSRGDNCEGIKDDFSILNDEESD